MRSLEISIKWIGSAAFLCSLALAVILQANFAEAAQITFDELEPSPIIERRIIDVEYEPVVTIRADNHNRPSNRDFAVVFNSRQNSSNPNDPDLLYPWDTGNIKNVRLGNILIIEEKGLRDTSDPNRINQFPDDEAGRPAGFIEFDFGIALVEFGFDLIDVEIKEIKKDSNAFASFQSSSGRVKEVPFSKFSDSSSPFYIDGLEFGDNSANRIDPLSAALLGLDDIDKVKIHLGGSSGIDNITYTQVPLPGSAILLLFGLLGLVGFKRRRRHIQ